uniref:Uncharacterized protein n=1 Tax=Bubo bubo TaxID=30461 RepID=A0A8C0I9Y2_BUBBB
PSTSRKRQGTAGTGKSRRSPLCMCHPEHPTFHAGPLCPFSNQAWDPCPGDPHVGISPPSPHSYCCSLSAATLRLFFFFGGAGSINSPSTKMKSSNAGLLLPHSTWKI